MADPISRQRCAAARLKAKLRKNRESLADEFEFKMFVIITFKNHSKKQAVFEVDTVYPVMTNDFEDQILQGVEDNFYSETSSTNLLSKDVVQLHARAWHSKRSDLIGQTNNIDFLIWPRSDISMIHCKLFSKWKHETDSSFKPILADFTLSYNDYMMQLQSYQARNQTKALVLTDPRETFFLFLTRNQLDQSRRNHAAIYRMSSLCVYLPQSELTKWAACTMDRTMKAYLDNN